MKMLKLLPLLLLLAVNSNAADSLKNSVFDADIYGSIVGIQGISEGRGAVGARATVWGNVFSESYKNIGFSVEAEADKFNDSVFLDRAIASVCYRFPELTTEGRFVPEIRLGGGQDFETDKNLAQTTVGASYRFSKHIAVFSEIGTRVTFEETHADWAAIGRAGVKFTF